MYLGSRSLDGQIVSRYKKKKVPTVETLFFFSFANFQTCKFLPALNEPLFFMREKKKPRKKKGLQNLYPDYIHII